jgi:biopolymer transport protein ExbD
MNTTELFGAGRKKARIEIIPLIDVIFFLLATFVLFTLSLDRIGSIGVTLPKVPIPPTPPPSETIVYLQASDEGTLYWKQGLNGTPELISLAELPARLSEYKHRVADPRILVRGDMRAKLGPAVMVLDEVRSAGISQVSIETLVSKTGG